MKIDFHVHGSLTSSLEFDPSFFLKTIARAKEIGLDAIALTDHFDADDYKQVHATLDQNYPYSGDCYLVEGIKVFPGIEVGVREGAHLLLIAGRETIATYYRRLEGHFTRDTFCSAQEYFDKQAGLYTLAIFAHPFRVNQEITRVDPALYTRFDAFDLNARDLYKYGPGARAQVEDFATDYGIPVVAGSDTHHYFQLGTVWNEFTESIETVEGLKRAIAAGDFAIGIDPDLKLDIARARATKQAIKADRLGV
jgi:predicted metal-dependent phosphoesterase TrpH